MKILFLDGQCIKKMLISGSYELENNKQQINDLNVFPIPDGDTGDNMSMTVNGGIKYIFDSEDDNIGNIFSSFSEGTFLSARGNSGVIISRIFTGISDVLKNNAKCSLDDFKNALENGIYLSYKAVSNPVEGTILTVFKNGVRRTCENESDFMEPDFISFFGSLLKNMNKALTETTEQLEILKSSGVVDSGGAGLVVFFSGMKKALEGNEVISNNSVKVHNNSGGLDFSKFTSESQLNYGYCTEFNLRLMTSKVGEVPLFDEKIIFDYLNGCGESLVFFRSESIIRVHVHTKKPGDILNFCQRYGEFLSIKIENMTLQHNESVFAISKKEIRKKYATLVVANGVGVCSKFKELGVDFVLNGGQSMNPSVDDFISAYKTLNAENIIVFPSNSNIIMTAQQSAENYNNSNIYVVENKDIGTSYTAIASTDFNSSLDEIKRQIDTAMKNTFTYSVSKANRDLKTETLNILSGDFITFKGKDIISTHKDRILSIMELLNKINLDDFSVLFLISGKNVKINEVEKLLNEINNINKDLEVLHINGGQPVYDYTLVFYN